MSQCQWVGWAGEGKRTKRYTRAHIHQGVWNPVKKACWNSSHACATMCTKIKAKTDPQSNWKEPEPRSLMERNSLRSKTKKELEASQASSQGDIQCAILPGLYHWSSGMLHLQHHLQQRYIKWNGLQKSMFVTESNSSQLCFPRLRPNIGCSNFGFLTRLDLIAVSFACHCFALQKAAAM